MATKRFDPQDFGAFLKLLPTAQDGVALAHVVDVRHESFACPEFVAMARAANVAICHTDSPDYPAIGDASGPFRYARLMRTVEAEPTGYPAKAIAAWADVARGWVAGRDAAVFPKAGDAPAEAGPCDVYLFYISGAKVRAPQAAMATIKRLAD